MHTDRILPVLLTAAIVLVDQCALRIAAGHHWPEAPLMCVVALFSSQLALLVAAAVCYRGLAVLRISATVCLTAVWCRWGTTLVGEMRHWVAMAAMIALPMAAALLVVRWLVTRYGQHSSPKNQKSRTALSVGELLSATSIVAMVFASVRVGLDASLDRPDLTLAAVSVTMSVLLIIALLSPSPRPPHVLALVPLTFLAAVTLSTTGVGSLETCFTWAVLHGVMLGGVLLILRASGLRLSGNTMRGIAGHADTSLLQSRPTLLETNP